MKEHRSAKIERLETACYRIPTDALEADGTLEWRSTEMVVVRVRCQGIEGLGYSYTSALAAESLIRDKLSPCIIDQNAMDIPALWSQMRDSLRNTGRPGLGMMAVAAVDIALWDLKARLLGIALADLLGSCRQRVPVYASGGFINHSDEELARQVDAWRQQGFSAGKIKISGDVPATARRLAVAREAAGEEFRLMVDANGAAYRRQALALAECLSQFQVSWLEEPVSSDDLAGLNWLRDRVPPAVAIAAGEYGWDELYFQRMMAGGAVDVVQADATRCGITGFMKVAALCEAFQLPLSAHCAPALHVPLGLATPPFVHGEYFHDHQRIESLLMDTGNRLEAGHLYPSPDRLGHGILIGEASARPYRI